jgi:O-antigen/teichoic acid export membrane protein
MKKTGHSSTRTLILGGAWAVGTRWSIRGIGFLNTVIMARLVLPADYGIVAMAYLVVGLIQALADFGATTALLRKDECTRDEIDSAWTLRILQGLGIGAILLIISPFAAMYFQEPRVQYILWVLAVCMTCAGASNIGLTLAQKEFKFSLEFRIQVIGKIVGVIATVVSGYLLRDYRALVIGISASYMCGIVLSYTMHPYRARWNTSKIGEIWALTKWLMLAGVGSFILRKGDEIIAARIGTASDFGLYNVGSDLGQMPTGEVGPAILRSLMPVLAAMRGSVSEVNFAIIKTISALNTITFPIGFGLAAISVQVTSLVLGAAWGGAAQYVAAFAILSTLQISQSPVNTLLTLRGYTKAQSVSVWLEFLVFIIAAIFLVPKYFLMGLVWARMLGVFMNMAITLVAAQKSCELSAKAACFATLRPAVGAILMYVMVTYVVSLVNTTSAQILFGIVCGVLSFICWSLATWLLAGRPDGLESTLLEFYKGYKIKKSFNDLY